MRKLVCDIVKSVKIRALFTLSFVVTIGIESINGVGSIVNIFSYVTCPWMEFLSKPWSKFSPFTINVSLFCGCMFFYIVSIFK